MRRRHVPGEPEPPSKGEFKRRAHASQELGEQLIEAPDALLDGLDLPEKLTDAIRVARRITSHSALLRQRLLIGKLLRQLDDGPIRAALAAREHAHTAGALAFRRIEGWRDRLLQADEPALVAFLEACPGADPKVIAQLVAEARRELEAGGPPRARRQLFRALRKALEIPCGPAAAGAGPPIPRDRMTR